jgi:hypothetical protein
MGRWAEVAVGGVFRCGWKEGHCCIGVIGKERVEPHTNRASTPKQKVYLFGPYPSAQA